MYKRQLHIWKYYNSQITLQMTISLFSWKDSWIFSWNICDMSCTNFTWLLRLFQVTKNKYLLKLTRHSSHHPHQKKIYINYTCRIILHARMYKRQKLLDRMILEIIFYFLIDVLNIKLTVAQTNSNRSAYRNNTNLRSCILFFNFVMILPR